MAAIISSRGYTINIISHFLFLALSTNSRTFLCKTLSPLLSGIFNNDHLFAVDELPVKVLQENHPPEAPHQIQLSPPIYRQVKRRPLPRQSWCLEHMLSP